MSNFPTLETDRLLLRELNDGDAERLFQIHGDAAAMRWYGSEPLASVDAAHKLIAVFHSWRTLPNPGVRWGIERKSDAAVIGTCGLFRWNRNWKNCTVGYELHQPAWGRGFMREAIAAVLPWGFAHMDLHRVEAQIHPNNAASIKLVDALGFVNEGVLREAGYWAGQFHNLLQYALLQPEYRFELDST